MAGWKETYSYIYYNLEKDTGLRRSTFLGSFLMHFLINTYVIVLLSVNYFFRGKTILYDIAFLSSLLFPLIQLKPDYEMLYIFTP